MFARALICLLGILLARDAIAEPPRIRAAYSSISAAMLPLFVAKDRGLFQKHGVEIDLTYIRGVAIEALIANEVQFVRASPPAVVRSTLRGADLAVIANTINVPLFSLMTRPDIMRAGDLKGKRIGVTGLGDSPDLVLSMVLEKLGIQRGKDVNIVSIHGGMPELMLAVSKGFVDGGMISAPSNLRGLKLGLRELIASADLGLTYLNSPLSTRRAFIKSHRDTVLRVLRAYYEAVQSTRTEPEASMKILGKYTRVQDREILAETYRIYGAKYLQKHIQVDLDGVAQLIRSLGKEAAGAKPALVVDATLIEELEREGFFKQTAR
jgi:ABC-type nitrate/sulfonate/bicarbonate transport system substrate-binding protein